MNPQLVYIISIIITMLLEGAFLVLYILLAVRNRQAFKKHWKPSLLLGLALFLMVVPSIVYAAIHLDPSAVFDHFAEFSHSSEALVPVVIAVGFFAVFVIHILCIGWHMVLYVVSASEWTKTLTLTFLKHVGEKKLPWLQICCAFAFGVFMGFVSVIVFHLLGVGEGEMFDDVNRFFPDMATSSTVGGLLVSILALTRMAIVEELVYRGGILAFLISKARNNRLAIIASLIIVSLTWALPHIPNTDAPLLKITQVFIIGLFLGEFARRSCIETAMAAHIGLNISAVTIEFILSNIC
ncbi:MAG: CPBP family glutamic-type intramembrane protease [Planctomycetota bacterium]|jgi:membrane protease YdiL (CAAX protease family)